MDARAYQYQAVRLERAGLQTDSGCAQALRARTVLRKTLNTMDPSAMPQLLQLLGAVVQPGSAASSGSGGGDLLSQLQALATLQGLQSAGMLSRPMGSSPGAFLDPPLQQTLPTSVSAGAISQQPAAPIRMTFQDDDVPLSSSWVFVGKATEHGHRRTVARTLKTTATHCINPDRFNMVMLSQLEDDEVDDLVFTLAGVDPERRVRSLEVSTRGEFRSMICREH